MDFGSTESNAELKIDIRDYLGGLDIRQLTFIRPSAGKEVVELFAGSERSPKTRIMCIEMLTLDPGRVVGFGRHIHTEKIYEKRNDACRVEIIAVIEGEPKRFELKYGDEGIAIPRTIPHAIIVTGGNKPAQIRTISSSRGIGDIQWQANYDDLCKNEHHIGETSFKPGE